MRGRTFPAAVDNPASAAEKCVPSDHPDSSVSDRCLYASEMENLDRLFGSLWDEVRAQGDEGNTLLCFASDHGEMLSDHGDKGKTMPWQGSASVPLMCTGPGTARGHVVSRPVAQIDLSATFLDFAGAARPEGMTAESLRPFLEGGTGEADAGKGRDSYRAFVSSGLQSFPFNQTFDEALAAAAAPREGGAHYSWRMVVEADTGLKFVCCRGACPGAPSNAPPVDAHGFTQILYDTVADPFDTVPISDRPEAVARLREQLPESFGCGQA